MAGRKKKPRRIELLPEYVRFLPQGAGNDTQSGVELTLDELEVIRLIDLEGLDQHHAAEQMGIARTTVAAVYAHARTTIADALVNGRCISIEGGCVTHNPQQPSTPIWREKQKEHAMRVAITYQDGTVFQHFGKTEYFKLYELEEGTVSSSEVVGTNGVGHGALAGLLAANGVDLLICGGIGGGALAALQKAGIAVYSGVTGPVDAALAAYLAGELHETSTAQCDCHGKNHHEGEHGGCSCSH